MAYTNHTQTSKRLNLTSQSNVHGRTVADFGTRYGFSVLILFVPAPDTNFGYEFFLVLTYTVLLTDIYPGVTQSHIFKVYSSIY